MLTQNQDKLEGMNRNGAGNQNTSVNGIPMRRYW